MLQLLFKGRAQLVWGAESQQSAAPIGALDRGKRDGVLVGGPSPHQRAVCECHFPEMNFSVILQNANSKSVWLI